MDPWVKSKNDTLDPLSIIIKLYIYLYKSHGSKISICNNKLIIQEGGLLPFQSIERAIKRDTKNDISILSMPIMYACNTYLFKDNRCEEYLNIFNKAAESLDKLKETYPGFEIIYTIDMLKTNIIDAVTNQSKITNTAYNSSGGQIKQHIYDNISEIWTEKRLEIVFGYMYEIDNSSSPELRDILINSFYSFMNYIDTIVHNLITTMT